MPAIRRVCLAKVLIQTTGTLLSVRADSILTFKLNGPYIIFVFAQLIYDVFNCWTNVPIVERHVCKLVEFRLFLRLLIDSVTKKIGFFYRYR